MKGGNGAEHGERVDALALEVEQIQGNLGHLVTELDHRRRQFFDVRRQLRVHPLVLGVLAVGALAAVGGTIALIVQRRRHRRSLAGRLERLREAAARMRKHPERVARQTPNIARKIAGAGGSALASVAGRRLGRELFGGKSG